VGGGLSTVMEQRARIHQRTAVLRLRNIVENVGSLRKGDRPRKARKRSKWGRLDAGDARHQLRPNAMITLGMGSALVITRV
jgi:hypothetical protein